MLAAFLSLIAVLLFVNLSYAAPATESKSIWTVSIFRGPAPPPEEGPPASANALRDPSKLKYETIGIAGAYLVWLAFTGIALLIVGRRLRRRQQRPNLTLQMETIKPTQVTIRDLQAGPKSPLSPKSPGKMASIRSWARRDKARHSEISISTVNTRVDERVIENDRAKNLDDMAKLYAAVMAHDEQRAVHKSHSSADSSPISDDVTPVTPKSPQCPPNLAHPAYVPPVSPTYSQHQPYSHHQEYPQPQSYQRQQTYQPAQAYQQQQNYPQHYRQESYDPMPPSPPPPMPIPTDNDRESLLDNQTSPRKAKPSALSLISNTASRMGSSHSSKARPSPITIRGQPISKPLGSADLRQSAFSPSQTSFQSSTLYSPGPPPPTPGRTQAQTQPQRTQISESIEMHGRPQLTSTDTNTPTTTTTTNPTKTLPFRAYQEALKSAPPTKTTFLDRRASAFNGPKTGVPKTPYSPYCPTTPMTPVTPRRMLGKEELKRNKKSYALGVVREREREDGLVVGGDEMWGTD
ncbi:hypothetical protein OHC33_000093 [Knufia fluminis]|uniref:Uncharacterized protein n=1 Tax=Knufia fluminis TaxID=191047 RepID=A0AAN8ICC1_9EURO|nr:hypothetical protein OHC33_000093 [Knufia fluminis]